jgi:hypothetical protein
MFKHRTRVVKYSQQVFINLFRGLLNYLENRLAKESFFFLFRTDNFIVIQACPSSTKNKKKSLVRVQRNTILEIKQKEKHY